MVSPNLKAATACSVDFHSFELALTVDKSPWEVIGSSIDARITEDFFLNPMEQDLLSGPFQELQIGTSYFKVGTSP